MKSANFPTFKFEEIKRLNPAWSSFICFCETIKHKSTLSPQTVWKYFLRLVDKDDWIGNPKKEILVHLVGLTKRGLGSV